MYEGEVLVECNVFGKVGPANRSTHLVPKHIEDVPKLETPLELYHSTDDWKDDIMVITHTNGWILKTRRPELMNMLQRRAPPPRPKTIKDRTFDVLRKLIG